jgi:hypothetical protein
VEELLEFDEGHGATFKHFSKDLSTVKSFESAKSSEPLESAPALAMLRPENVFWGRRKKFYTQALHCIYKIAWTRYKFLGMVRLDVLWCSSKESGHLDN